MKKSLIILTSLLALQTQAQTPHDWENPAVLGINKLPYHYSQATVTAEISICNTGKKNVTVCPVMIIDKQSPDMAEMQVNAGDTINCTFYYTLDNPRLWSAEKLQSE